MRQGMHDFTYLRAILLREDNVILPCDTGQPDLQQKCALGVSSGGDKSSTAALGREKNGREPIPGELGA
jgi:hypothetical protein